MSLIKTSIRKYTPVMSSVGEHIKSAQYAVRGAIPIRGQEIAQQLKTAAPGTFDFSETSFLNIGNPQQCGQGNLTFNRQVIAGLSYPPIAKTNMISEDAKKRIDFYNRHQSSPVGAYTTNSKGWTFAREAVAKYISNRDGVQADPERIYLTNGASEGVRLIMSALIRDSNDGMLVPIPQYPLYSALLTLNKAKLLPYYLQEEKNWGLDAEGLLDQITRSIKSGITPRAIVVINPGNPTGQVMKKEDLQAIIKLCHEHSIMILSDEVYQTNIYKDTSKFVSMRQALHDLGEPYSNTVELVSFNSVSKGMMGECGLRGGYFETHNLSDDAEALIFKLKSIELCSNTIGQTAVELMVNPPAYGQESDETVEQYQREHKELFCALKDKAQLLTSAFNDMQNVSCTEIEGAMYGFPRIHFSQKFIDEAHAQGVEPDFKYCMDMVNQTGIMTVPGSGFWQEPGTYHFRITNLVTPIQKMETVLENLHAFNKKWQAQH